MDTIVFLPPPTRKWKVNSILLNRGGRVYFFKIICNDPELKHNSFLRQSKLSNNSKIRIEQSCAYLFHPQESWRLFPSIRYGKRIMPVGENPYKRHLWTLAGVVPEVLTANKRRDALSPLLFFCNQ